MKSLIQSALFIVFISLVGCNQNKGKVITQEQEDKLNQVEVREKDLEAREKELADSIEELVTRTKELRQKEDELVKRQTESIRRESIDPSASASAQSPSFPSPSSPPSLENKDLETQLSESRKEIEILTAKVAEQTAELKALQVANKEQLSRYNMPLAVRSIDEGVAGGKVVPVLILISSRVKEERDSLRSKIIPLHVGAAKDRFERPFDGNGVFTNQFVVFVNSSDGIHKLLLETEQLPFTVTYAQLVKTAKIRSYINLHLKSGETVTYGLRNSPPFEIGAAFETSNYRDPVAAGGFPAVCRTLVDVTCLKTIAPLMDYDVVYRQPKLKISKFTLRGFAGPIKLRSLAMALLQDSSSNRNRNENYVTHLTITHDLMVEGDLRGRQPANRLTSTLKDTQYNSSKNEWFYTPILLPAYPSLNLEGLVLTDYVENVRALARALE